MTNKPQRRSPSDQPDEHAVQLSSQCPLCGATFKPSDADIVDESRQGILFHLTCNSCRASLLAVVSASKLGLSSFGMVTDLTAKDVRKMRRTHAIDQEDVLEAYQEISEYNGNISNLFSNNGKHLAQRKN